VFTYHQSLFLSPHVVIQHFPKSKSFRAIIISLQKQQFLIKLSYQSRKAMMTISFMQASDVIGLIYLLLLEDTGIMYKYKRFARPLRTIPLHNTDHLDIFHTSFYPQIMSSNSTKLVSMKTTFFTGVEGISLPESGQSTVFPKSRFESVPANCSASDRSLLQCKRNVIRIGSENPTKGQVCFLQSGNPVWRKFTCLKAIDVDMEGPNSRVCYEMHVELEEATEG